MVKPYSPLSEKKIILMEEKHIFVVECRISAYEVFFECIK